MAYACTNTEIQNVTNGPLVLSMFGRTLAGKATFTVPGSVWGWLKAKHPGIKGRRMIEKFASLIDTDYLRIVTNPSSDCGASSSSGWVPTPHGSSSSSAADWITW